MPRKKTTRTQKKEQKEKASTKEEPQQEKQPYPRTLYRSSTNKVLGGVAGGLGEYFGIDPAVIRIIFILLTVFGGSGILIYIILWIIIPPENHINPNKEETMRQNMQEMRDHMRGWTDGIRTGRMHDGRLWGGILLLILGIMFLAGNFGGYFGITTGRLWPLILIVIGLAILARQY